MESTILDIQRFSEQMPEESITQLGDIVEQTESLREVQKEASSNSEPKVEKIRNALYGAEIVLENLKNQAGVVATGTDPRLVKESHAGNGGKRKSYTGEVIADACKGMLEFLRFVNTPMRCVEESDYVENLVESRAREKTKDIEDPEERETLYAEEKERLLAGLNYETIFMQVYGSHVKKYTAYAEEGERRYLHNLRVFYKASANMRAVALSSKLFRKTDNYKRYQRMLIDKAQSEVIRLVLEQTKSLTTVDFFDDKETDDKKNQEEKGKKKDEKSINCQENTRKRLGKVSS